MDKRPLIPALCAALILSNGCATQPSDCIVATKAHVPHLWSDYIDYPGSVRACTQLVKEVIEAEGFKFIAEKNAVSYGNKGSSRVLLHCLVAGEQSLIYVAVTGNDAKPVEKIRNTLMWRLSSAVVAP